MRLARPRMTRLLGSVAVAALLGLALAGCKTTGDDITGSIGSPAAPPRTEADWRRSLDIWGERYKADPGDAEAAINYAKALRATEQRAQAVAVLEQASLRHPQDMTLLGAYGRALADAGDYAQALNVLDRAHTPDNPDWRILNAQGAVLDQLGRHAEAQRHYAAALKIVPDEPSVLSNLGLSYALTKDLEARRGDAAARGGAAECDAEGAAESGAGGRACRAASPRPRRSPPPTCRRTRPRPTSIICARCWRSSRNWQENRPRDSCPTPDAGT